MLLKLAVILSIPLFTVALPKGGRPPKNQSCPVDKAVLTFPAGQTALAIPAGQVPNHILLGTGVQNYTCTDAGTYTYASGPDSIQYLANLNHWFVDLLVPSPSCATFLACTAPQNSIQSRTTSVSTGAFSRSNSFPPDPRVHTISDHPPTGPSHCQPLLHHEQCGRYQPKVCIGQ